jgi:hypothetical protein
MTLGASIAILAFVIAVIGVVAYVCSNPRPKSRKRPKKESLEPLSDPPTITHYGHG